MQRSALCRSRWELSNAYLLAKFGLDTAENEPCQVCPIEQCSSPAMDRSIGAVPFASPPRMRKMTMSTGRLCAFQSTSSHARGWDTYGKIKSLNAIGRKLKELNQARSRLYRNLILQLNTRWKAFAEIYTMDSILQISNRKKCHPPEMIFWQTFC